MSCLCWLHIQLALSYLCILLYVVSFVYYVQQNIIEKKKKKVFQSHGTCLVRIERLVKLGAMA